MRLGPVEDLPREEIGVRLNVRKGKVPGPTALGQNELLRK